MQYQGIRGDWGEEENVSRRKLTHWEQADWDHEHLLNRWDFEELLAELRRCPVLRSNDSKHPIIAKEYFARA